MNILITGAAGFVGKHLINNLSTESNQIWCVIRNNRDKETIAKYKELGINIIFGDLKNIKEINLPKNIDVVIHLSALVDTIDFYSYKTLYRENTKVTKDLADYYSGKIKKFIYLSSMAAIGVTENKTPIDENFPCRPVNPYGKSKLAAEKYLLKLYEKKNFPVIIFRPPTVYGPGDKYNFKKLVEAIDKGMFWVIGSGKNKMSWCYAPNLVQAIILSMKSKVSGEVFLIDDGRAYSLNEIYKEIARALGKNVRKFKIPMPVAYIAALFFEPLSFLFNSDPPISRKRINTLTSNFTFNIGKAEKMLGYKPKISFSEAVTKTVDSFGLKIANKLEEEIVLASRSEGIGSIYERIILKRFFEKLVKKYSFDSVLEYGGIKITKGIDNKIFKALGKDVKIADGDKKVFGKYDLVWNFAVLQKDPEFIEKMILHSGKYVMIFVPNYFNWGMPFHEAYHILIDHICKHAESGSVRLRTKRGISKLLHKSGITILESGFIDIPFLPDIGFSMRELKGKLGIKVEAKKASAKANTCKTLDKIEKLGFIERFGISNKLKFPFAHHIYIIGKVS